MASSQTSQALGSPRNARRVQQNLPCSTTAAGGISISGGGGSTRTAPVSTAVPSTAAAGPGPSMAMATATAAGAAHEVVELDDSSSDSDGFQIISVGYGPWNPLLPTHPAVAYYQLEIISLTLGPSSRRGTSQAASDEGFAWPTEVGLLMTLEFGKDRQFSQYRRGRGEEFNIYRVEPVQDSSKALLSIKQPRPNYSVPMAMFGEVPEEWPFADPGIREGESARIRIELNSLRSRAGPHKANEWVHDQLKTSSSYAGIPPAAREYALGGDLPFGFVNIPLSPGLEEVVSADSSVAPLFWAGTKIEPKPQWNLRFRWRCNSTAAWRAEAEN